MAYIVVSTKSSSDRVCRVWKPGHTFRVGDVLYRADNDQTWALASLTDLSKFDSWLVTAIDADWFEVPSIKGCISIPNHGFGDDGTLIFMDWRVDGKITIDNPPIGAKRLILGKIVNKNTIDYDPDYTFMTVS